MQIIGCDLHARQQTLAMLDTETRDVVNRTFTHEGHSVREFYSALPDRLSWQRLPETDPPPDFGKVRNDWVQDKAVAADAPRLPGLPGCAAPGGALGDALSALRTLGPRCAGPAARSGHRSGQKSFSPLSFGVRRSP
jgi:hypothetical protein